MPAAVNSSSVSRTCARSSSLRLTRPSGTRPDGSVGRVGSPKASASGRPANSSTRRPWSAHSSACARQSGPPPSLGSAGSPSSPPRASCPPWAAASLGAHSPARAASSASGAPRMNVPGGPSSAKLRPLHLRSDENSASCAAATGSTGYASCSASAVRFTSVVLAAYTPSSASSCARVAPNGRRSWTRSTFDVRVPVLSVQSTSTLESDSTALPCWISIPLPSIRNAPRA